MSNSQEIVKLFLKLIIWWYDNEKPVNNIVRQEKQSMIAIVTRLANPPQAGADWNKPPWQEIPSELIRNYMGEKPGHFPKTEVKIAYEDKAIYLVFRVEDRYVRATAVEHQDSVCGDSCVEFFFTPGSDVSKGY
ncbi:MAG: carbohydrate-binding family 9-like protein, partial [Deltaproteobacteria bacterium]|nr:carbohydrate-binding family 9-like protein [Deltaproteobacteria bacterium]